jgi:hypothetical protein
VNVHVDQAGRDDFTRRVDHVVIAGGRGVIARNPPILDAQIADLIQRLARIDQATTANEQRT